MHAAVIRKLIHTGKGVMTFLRKKNAHNQSKMKNHQVIVYKMNLLCKEESPILSSFDKEENNLPNT